MKSAQRQSFKIGAPTKVAKFPLAKFKRYIKHLKIQSRDYGRVSLRLLGSQKYILDEMVKGLSEGITTFVVLKGRQQGSTTLFLAVDFFYALAHPGLLGTFILHEEKALAKWRAQIEIQLASMPKKVDGKRFRPNVISHNRNILLF